MKVGDKVTGQWQHDDECKGDWYPGRVVSIDEVNETIHIEYEDGDTDTALSWEHVMLTE